MKHQLPNTESDPRAVERRVLLKGAAWTVPVVATAVAVPLAAASHAPNIEITEVFSFEEGLFSILFEVTVNGQPVDDGFSAQLVAGHPQVRFDTEQHEGGSTDTVVGTVFDGHGLLHLVSSEVGAQFTVQIAVLQSSVYETLVVPPVEA